MHTTRAEAEAWRGFPAARELAPGLVLVVGAHDPVLLDAARRRQDRTA